MEFTKEHIAYMVVSLSKQAFEGLGVQFKNEDLFKAYENNLNEFNEEEFQKEFKSTYEAFIEELEAFKKKETEKKKSPIILLNQ